MITPYSIPNSGMFPNIEIGRFVTSQLCLSDLHTFSKTSKDNKDFVQFVALEYLNYDKLTSKNLGLYDVENVIDYFGIQRCSKIYTLNLVDVDDVHIESIAKTFINIEKLSIERASISDRPFSYCSKMSKLKEFKLSGFFARTKLEFLQYLKELTTLELTNITDITNLQFINRLNKLQSIKICRFNQIKDYTFLKDLTNLTYLYLEANREVEHLAFLSCLSNLNRLTVSLSTIADLEHLINLKKLTHLNLSNSRICTNFDYLQFFTTIENLDLNGCVLASKVGFNSPSDLGFLSTLLKLKSLNLAGLVEVINFDFFKNLSKITYLDLSDCKINDLTLLKDLPLTHLSLSKSTAQNFSALRSFKNLSNLDLSGTHFIDARLLQNLTNLSHLNLRGTSIVETSVIKNLTQLKVIDLSFCISMTDFNCLQPLTSLSNLILKNANIIDASPLQSLTNLKIIDLSYCRFMTDFNFLHSLTNLHTLNLKSTNIIDLSILKNLTKLTTLYLSTCTQIRDYGPLLNVPNLEKFDLDEINSDKAVEEALKKKGIQFIF